MPLIPAPPMPMKCTAPSSAQRRAPGPVHAATSAALTARHLQHDVGQPLVGVRRTRRPRRAGPTAASAAGR